MTKIVSYINAYTLFPWTGKRRKARYVPRTRPTSSAIIWSLAVNTHIAKASWKYDRVIVDFNNNICKSSRRAMKSDMRIRMAVEFGLTSECFEVWEWNAETIAYWTTPTTKSISKPIAEYKNGYLKPGSPAYVGRGALELNSKSWAIVQTCPMLPCSQFGLWYLLDERPGSFSPDCCVQEEPDVKKTKVPIIHKKTNADNNNNFIRWAHLCREHPMADILQQS